MRILFTSLAFPFPPNKGHRVRNNSLLVALAREDHRVTLVSFAGPEDGAHLSEAKEYCERVITVPEPQPRMPWDMLRRLHATATATPFGAKRFSCPRMAEALLNELRRDAYDAVFCDDIYMFGNLPSRINLPVLLNKHDLTYEIMERYAAYETNPVKRAYVLLEARNVRRWEMRVCAYASAVLACSERDRQIIAKLSTPLRANAALSGDPGFCPRTPICVVPNVIDVERYRPAGASGDDGQTMLYIGAMDWHPNRDAVRYFVREILPVIRRLVPGVRFVVAGRGASLELRNSLRADDVVFTGEVPDMAAQLATATVCVVPLRIGSGTRLKIIEAAAMEKATVSTSLGAEGLEFAAPDEVILADTTETFARATAELLKAPERRARMGSKARARALESYSIAALEKALRSVLSAVASADCRAGSSG
jgi:glycosyltransferase involved in cell wall biosynthesis